MVFGAVAFGGLSWLATVWQFGDFGLGIGFILFVFVIWLLGGVAWGWCMWYLMLKPRSTHGTGMIEKSERPKQ